MTNAQIYRRWLFVLLAIVLLISGYYFLWQIRNQIPNELMIQEGESFSGDVKFCTVTIEEKAVEATGGGPSTIPESQIDITGQDSSYQFTDVGSYTVDYKLLGIIDLKSVDVNVVEEQTVIPGGYPAGIYVETEGVMIIGTSHVNGMDGNTYEPAKNIVKSGDYVVSINGEGVTEKEQLINKVNAYGAEDIVLGIRRDGELIEVKMKAVQTSADEYKLGIWIRDNTQGVGMVTYFRENGEFGALGHGITDVDTGLLMNISRGTLFQTEIVSIIRGQDGTPGELVGMIDYRNERMLGDIQTNTSVGIFGKVEALPEELQAAEAVQVAGKHTIEKGKAYIQTCVDGSLKQYEIEIEQININDTGNKGMVIKITDERLLKKTGGIVQGMFTSYNGSNNRKASKIKGFLMF